MADSINTQGPITKPLNGTNSQNSTLTSLAPKAVSSDAVSQKNSSLVPENKSAVTLTSPQSKNHLAMSEALLELMVHLSKNLRQSSQIARQTNRDEALIAIKNQAVQIRSAAVFELVGGLVSSGAKTAAAGGQIYMNLKNVPATTTKNESSTPPKLPEDLKKPESLPKEPTQKELTNAGLKKADDEDDSDYQIPRDKDFGPKDKTLAADAKPEASKNDAADLLKKDTAKDASNEDLKKSPDFQGEAKNLYQLNKITALGTGIDAVGTAAAAPFTFVQKEEEAKGKEKEQDLSQAQFRVTSEEDIMQAMQEQTRKTIGTLSTLVSEQQKLNSQIAAGI